MCICAWACAYVIRGVVLSLAYHLHCAWTGWRGFWQHFLVFSVVTQSALSMQIWTIKKKKKLDNFIIHRHHLVMTQKSFFIHQTASFRVLECGFHMHFVSLVPRPIPSFSVLNAEKLEGLAHEVTWLREKVYTMSMGKDNERTCHANGIHTVRPEAHKHRVKSSDWFEIYSHSDDQLLWCAEVIPTNHHCWDDGLY